jgi:glucose-1-phosphate thymidylyltransferase
VEHFKAVVLADACRGGEASSLIDGRASQLVSVANKPVLFHALEALRDAGITEVAMVLHPRISDEIREAVRDGSRWGLRVCYLVRHQLGLAHALRAAGGFLGESPFVVYPGNGVLAAPLRPLLTRFTRARLHALVPLRRVEDPSRHTVALMDGTRLVEAISEPLDSVSNLALDGVYVFGPAVHAAVRTAVPSWRGQLELADTINALLRGTERLEARITAAWWSYQGQPQELLEGNRLLLERLVDDRGDALISDSSIEGRAAISSSARVDSTTICGPVIIGPGACLTDSYIGPYTSVGASALVQGAEVENSIIMAGAEVKDLGARLAGSIVGEGACVYRDFTLSRVHHLFVGYGTTAALG